jgi:hypothetical protein
MHQHGYISTILQNTDMQYCKPLSTPALSNDMSPVTESAKEAIKDIPYRQTIGALLYLSTGTRPDIAAAVATVARNYSGKDDWKAVKRVLHYLKGINHLGIILSGNNLKITGFADASRASDPDKRRSTTGYVFLLGEYSVTWKSKLRELNCIKFTGSRVHGHICSVSRKVVVAKVHVQYRFRSGSSY